MQGPSQGPPQGPPQRPPHGLEDSAPASCNDVSLTALPTTSTIPICFTKIFHFFSKSFGRTFEIKSFVSFVRIFSRSWHCDYLVRKSSKSQLSSPEVLPSRSKLTNRKKTKAKANPHPSFIRFINHLIF